MKTTKIEFWEESFLINLVVDDDFLPCEAEAIYAKIMGWDS